MFARIGQPTSGRLQKRIAAPRFAEDRPPIWLENALDLGNGPAQVKMVEDGVTPDAIKRSSRKRKLFPSSLNGVKACDGAAGDRSRGGFFDVSTRQIESSHQRTTFGQ